MFYYSEKLLPFLFFVTYIFVLYEKNKKVITVFLKKNMFFTSPVKLGFCLLHQLSVTLSICVVCFNPICGIGKQIRLIKILTQSPTNRSNIVMCMYVEGFNLTSYVAAISYVNTIR